MGSPIALLPLPREHTAHGLHDELEVRPEARLQDVEHVEVYPLREGDGVAVAPGLPVAGDAGAHGEAQLLVHRVLPDLARKGRAGPDDGHVAREHVPELGQLVEGGLAQQPAHARHARVLGDLEDRSVLLVGAHERLEALLGVDAHRSELDHPEGAAAKADALLEEQRRAVRIIQEDRQGYCQQ